MGAPAGTTFVEASVVQGRDLSTARHEVALACRILAHQGLSEDILGHVSLRQGTEMLIRCRGPHERGLLFTTEEDIRLVSLTGDLLEPAGGYEPPKEWPIHAEIYQSRPNVESVIHAHPPWVVALELAGLDLVPLIGAYDIPASRLAARGIPTYPRGVLIDEPGLAAEMLASMGDASVCLLKGHGITSTGTTLQEAMSHALALQSLAQMTVRVAQLGGKPTALAAADLEQLPDLGRGFNHRLMWNHCVARLGHEGLNL